MADLQIKDVPEADAQDREKDQRAERIAVIDYKMVTFSLAGKDYGIDIMQVKEIAKAGRFTYVPNTSPFVLGVYNLRGDIIPIIDLRIFFNIPVKAREADALENMIIINVEDQTFGIVVDAIDKVIGISRSTIQPPHPIFGDINIKYIHGVVENQGRLYILLEVSRIFGSRAKAAEAEKVQEVQEKLATETVNPQGATRESIDLSFVTDTLASLGRFHVSHINDRWVSERLEQWRQIRGGADVQFAGEEDAKQYLETFYSPDTGSFWGDAYVSAFQRLLPQNQAKQINVWNIGCAKGHESYSIAVAMKEKYPNARIRVYANDSDLLAISNAPMLSVDPQQVSPRYKPWLVQGVGGAWTFNQTIKDMILFEYHDCTNQNAVPPMDVIVVRDVLSFMNLKQQASMMADITEKLKDNGIVLLGANEAMPQHSGWTRSVEGKVVVFGKE